MKYRRLGRSGLQVSELSYGSWITYCKQVDLAAARQHMAAAFDAGGTLYIAGNGGSAADAMHVAVEFMHPVIARRPPIRAA